MGEPPPLAPPPKGRQPILPAFGSPAWNSRSHDQDRHARWTSPTCTGQAPLCRRYLFKEFFFFNVGLSEQVQEEKRKKWGKQTNNNGFLFPSWGGEGDLVGCLCIATQTMKTHLEAQSQVRLDVQWGLSPNEAPKNLIS